MVIAAGMKVNGESVMKTLIAEDDFTSSLLLQEILKPYGPQNLAVNGKDAVEAVRASLETGEPYDLVCLDIMMPEMDGQTVLRRIREMEDKAGIFGPDGAKIIMTTALGNKENILEAFAEQCDGYLIKPIRKDELLRSLRKLKLIP